ncbi:MAG: Stk1 family PASTA domain-containing Ser/Thr kinase, partial [Acidimicrobiia bacterium]|nr:Stk1 family PASTA domain-containing Ser/Thr kinase [Acidimicrobiia bacterium]
MIASRYELRRRLARGGMADVYLALDRVLDRPVAIKVMFASYAADPKFVARFRREAQSAGRLGHPNIVAVYDWGAHDDTYYIAMEYIDGQTLSDVVAERGPLDIAEAEQIASEIADALAFAHQQGTIHRDIKPSNILLTSSGQAKVTDFGIARAFEGDADLTETGKVMGTAAYFSPEQAQGHQLDQRSDLYALGVVLFEMVTGHPPFSGTSPVAIAYKHVEEAPSLASSRRASVPADLDAVIDTLLAKNPAQRYPTAADVRDALDRLWNNEPLGATAPPGSSQIAATTALELASRPSTAPDHGGALPPTQAMTDPAAHYGEPTAPGYQPSFRGAAPPPNRTGLYGVVVAILFVAAAALVALIVVNTGGTGSAGSGQRVEVPNVIGNDQATAVERLAAVDLLADVRFERNDETVPGVVFAQDPAGRSEVEAQSTVTVLVSVAEETVEVPDVAGRSVDDARAQLEALGFEVVIDEQPSDELEVGQVISQSVQAGEQANQGATITLVVSSGADSRQMPSVLDQSQATAAQLLTDAGFVPRVELVDVDPNGGSVGLVVSQSPEGGQEAPAGSEVVIRVGQAPDTTSTSSSTTPTSTPTTTPTSTTTTTTPTSTTTTTTPTSTTTATTTTTT